MSLPARLIAAILLSLAVCFAAGAGLAVWRAARSVRVELAAALVGAQRSAAVALDGRGAGASDGELRRVVATFDGSRHVKARWVDADGAVQAESRPEAGAAPPSWFEALAAPTLPDVAIQAGASSVRLAADATNETEERWRDLQEQVGLLALFSAVAASLCAVTVTVSLRPLTALSLGLARMGRGEPHVRLAARGPPEVAELASAFNALAEAVRKGRTQNARLQAQMATIAEEERLEIARDLHDEFGPLLFAISAFAATIGRMAEVGDLAAIPAQLASVQNAVAALQRQVRDMLGRMHEPDCETSDLAESTERLLAFWRTVRPEVSFAAELPPEVGELREAVRDALHRSAQEAVSNAVRHGRPRSVRVRVATRDGAAVLTVADDGGGGGEGPGLGLAGMRARAAALGGRVEIERGSGWTVTVVLPLAPAGAEPGPSTVLPAT